MIIQGYKTIWINKEKKQYRLHRFLMEKFLGRKLNSKELVHHKNGDRFDNRLKNLEIVNRSEHKKIHSEIGEKTRIKQKFFFEEKELNKLRELGLTMQKIADIYGCTQPTVFRALKRYGIK